MNKLKKIFGINPSFTERELIAVKVLSTIYLEGVDWESDKTNPEVKETLESIKEKVKGY
jgi:hypothetical protein